VWLCSRCSKSSPLMGGECHPAETMRLRPCGHRVAINSGHRVATNSGHRVATNSGHRVATNSGHRAAPPL
ncbi:MAG: hypothetical protein K5683_05375, partial [Prevotella sp.]|nr:hypothetical protein [Prevotella sp.]